MDSTGVEELPDLRVADPELAPHGAELDPIPDGVHPTEKPQRLIAAASAVQRSRVYERGAPLASGDSVLETIPFLSYRDVLQGSCYE